MESYFKIWMAWIGNQIKMKLYEILEKPKIEQVKEKVPELYRAIENIKRECQPFLSQSKGAPMMRGVVANSESSVPLSSEESIRMDRKPRNSSSHPFFNWSFNAVIEEKFKITKVRNTSLFCSGSYGVATYYGYPTFVFPKGNFKYLWSPKVNDSYEDLPKLPKYYLKFVNQVGSELNTKYEDLYTWRHHFAEPFFRSLLEKGDFKLDSMLDSKDPIIAEIRKVVEDDYDSYKTSGLTAALKSGNEILISGPLDYYYINIQKLAFTLGVKNVYTDIYNELLKLLAS